MSKKQEFPNNWEMFNQAPEEFFPTPTYEEVINRFLHWELPSSVNCVMRITDKRTKKITETAYIRHHAAQARLDKLIASNTDLDVLIMEQEDIHHLFTDPMDGSGRSRPDGPGRV